MLAAAAIVAVILSGIAFNQRSLAQNSAATATYAQGQAQVEAATLCTAQADAQYQAEQVLLRQSLKRWHVRRLKKPLKMNQWLARKPKKPAGWQNRELVAFALAEMEHPSDVSHSLGLLLAREAVLMTLKTEGFVTGSAEAVLRHAINVAPVLQLTLSGHLEAINYPLGVPMVTLSSQRVMMILLVYGMLKAVQNCSI